MKPIDVLLAKLPGAKKAGNGWSAPCPAHNDNRPSLTGSECDDGTVRVKCHAGCDTSAVLAAIGLKLSDLFSSNDGPAATSNGKPKPSGPAFPTANDAVVYLERQHGKRSAMWTYHDASGKPVGLVLRWNK